MASYSFSRSETPVPMTPIYEPLNTTANGVMKKNDDNRFSQIPVEQFGEYVTHCHDDDNSDFKDQFNVILYYIGLIMVYFVNLCLYRCWTKLTLNSPLLLVASPV